MTKFIKFAIIGIIILVAAILLFSNSSLVKNLQNVWILKSYFSGNPGIQAVAIDFLRQSVSQDCQANWMIARMTGNQEQESAYREALNCGPDYLKLAAVARPLDIPLATQAVQDYPQSSDAWFWLAGAQYPIDVKTALASYYEVVNFDPSYALAWCQIGWILEHTGKTSPALDAYLQCFQGGITGNGSYGAGRMEDKLGNLELAIYYYRLSQVDVAIQRANELGNQLSSSGK